MESETSQGITVISAHPRITVKQSGFKTGWFVYHLNVKLQQSLFQA